MFKRFFGRIRKKRYNLFDLIGGGLLIQLLLADFHSWAMIYYSILFAVWILVDVFLDDEDDLTIEISGTIDQLNVMDTTTMEEWEKKNEQS